MKKVIYLLIVIVSVLNAEWHFVGFAPWSGRYDHTVSFFRDSLWLIGGTDTSGVCGDIWVSGNGREWYLVTDAAPFGRVSGHTVTVYNENLWLIGGRSEDTNISSAIWRSRDGRSWVKVTDSAPFGPRWLHVAITFHDFLWVIGGRRTFMGTPPLNEIWRFDGRSWTLVQEHAVWKGRQDHTVTPFKDTLWLIGGVGAYGDSFSMYCSGDGVSWFGAVREWLTFSHISFTYHQKLWIVGGPYPEVLVTEDGRHWRISHISPFTGSGRKDLAGIVVRDTLWVFGGASGYYDTLYNDIWYMVEPLGIEEKDDKFIIPQSVTPTPTIIRNISHLRVIEPIILLDPTGRKVVDLKSATNKNLKPGIYFLIPNTRSELRKIVLIK